MKVAIGTAITILIACIVMGYVQMKHNSTDNPQVLEIERLKKREAQLETALQSAPAHQNTPSSINSPAGLEQVAEQQAQLKELERVRAELKKFNAMRDEVEEKANVIVEATEIKALDPLDKRSKRRASLIKSALVMASISKYDTNAKIAEIKIHNVGNVNTGDILGIRRNSGIIGRVSVSTVEREQGIADPIPASFMSESIDINPGDELILPPDL